MCVLDGELFVFESTVEVRLCPLVGALMICVIEFLNPLRNQLAFRSWLMPSAPDLIPN
jgi:hypothetical protein